MLKKYLGTAVLVAVFAVGFAAPQIGRAQTADDEYIKTLQGIVQRLLLQVQKLTEQLNALSTSTEPIPIPLPGSPEIQPSVNRPPTVSISGSSTVRVGFSEVWYFQATDPEGFPLSYSLSWGDGTSSTIGTARSGSGFNLSHTYTRIATSTITFRATDRGGLASTAYFYIFVIGSPASSPVESPTANQPPVIQAFFGSSTVTVGTENLWTLRATDSDDPRLYYSVSWGDNSSSSYTASSSISVFAPHTYLQTGFRLLQLYVSDGRGGTALSSTTVSVVSSTPNQPPVVSVSGSSTVPVGFSDVWYFRATDPEGLNLSYVVNWGDGSAVASGTTASGRGFNLGHTYTRVGTSTIVFTATDIGGLQAIAFFPVRVLLSNQSPFFVSPFLGPSSTVSGVSATWYATAWDPDGVLLNYRVQWGDGSADTTRVASSGVPMSFPHTYYASTSTYTYYPMLTVSDFGSPAQSIQSRLTVLVFPAPGGGGGGGSPPPRLPDLDASVYNSLQGQLDSIRSQLEALQILLRQY